MPTPELLADLRHRIGDFLEYRAIRRHRSRLGRMDAPRYTHYLEECRRHYTGDVSATPEVAAAVAEFERKNVASFWTPENHRLAGAIMAKLEAQERSGQKPWNERGQYAGDVYTAFPEFESLFRGSLGRFLTASFRAPFKIYYGMIYQSERLAARPRDSQLWHADGGPGTCIIVMIYLRDVAREDGALECLPWEHSVEVYRRERAVYRQRLAEAQRHGAELSREAQRKIKCDYYEEEIRRRFAASVEQPVGRAGLVAAFGNNVLHRGGFPEPGRLRCVSLFHCYPSTVPTRFERYRQSGVKKVESYPKDPAAEF